jgi:MinD superfamily P-loop ATPase
MRAEEFTLAVASGKGGTGKTLVATNLAAIGARSGPVVLVDCDVEAPNAHLFFEADRRDTVEVTVPRATVDADACGACGTCVSVCEFGAVRVLGEQAIVFDELCHGCGSCSHACPSHAMGEKEMRVGDIDVSVPRGMGALTVVTGTMDVGQTTAPAMIRAARKRAEDHGGGLTIIDAPPGVSCSAVAAVHGADAVLLVTEPTVFGLHDLRLAAELARELGLPAGVLVNRAGSGSTDIERFCDEWDMPVVGHVPFEKSIAETYAKGELVVGTHPDVAEWLGYVTDAMWSIAETQSYRAAARQTAGARS